MDKKKIIALLEATAKVYEYAIREATKYSRKTRRQFYNLLEHFNIEDGLCCHFSAMCTRPDYRCIKDELFKDTSCIFYRMHWYTPPFMVPSVLKMVSEALQPRLDHLNRTIARLQNELLTPTA